VKLKEGFLHLAYSHGTGVFLIDALRDLRRIAAFF
jgi:hypothetical protein